MQRNPPPIFHPVLVRNPSKQAVYVFGQGLSFKAPTESPPLEPGLISFELSAAKLVEDRNATSCLGLRGIRALPHGIVALSFSLSHAS
jgi:hypothetical protein